MIYPDLLLPRKIKSSRPTPYNFYLADRHFRSSVSTFAVGKKQVDFILYSKKFSLFLHGLFVYFKKGHFELVISFRGFGFLTCSHR